MIEVTEMNFKKLYKKNKHIKQMRREMMVEYNHAYHNMKSGEIHKRIFTILKAKLVGLKFK
jgi:hypothetical protein